MKYRSFVFLVVSFVTPVVASAQTVSPAFSASDRSSFGFSASFTPTWKVPSQIGDQFDATVDIEGNEFTVGLIRGRSRGGDWGLSFVRKVVKNGSTVAKASEDCFGNTCYDTSSSIVTQDITLTGVELHKFIPFGTIKGRVQIGLNLGIGAASTSGTVVETEHDYRETFVQGNPNPVRTPTTEVTTQEAKEYLGLSVAPLAHLGAAVAIIAGPNVKLRWEGGLSLPGISYTRIMATVLFGRR